MMPLISAEAAQLLSTLPFIQRARGWRLYTPMEGEYSISMPMEAECRSGDEELGRKVAKK